MSEDTPSHFGSDATSFYAQQPGAHGEYEGDDREKSSDQVDPKKLVQTPSNDDIRWYYRNGAIASTVIDKPIQDAFKHGYSIDDEDTQAFAEEVETAYKSAHKKARRDGFALMWFRLRDTNKSWQPPENVTGIHEVKTLTLDDMTRAKPLAFEEKLSSGNEENFDHDPSVNVQGEFKEVNTLAELVERAEGDRLPTQDDDVRRLPRSSEDQQRLATDMLRDPDVEQQDMEGRLPYGRSRYYDTTDNGIVISNRLDDTRFEEPIGYLYDRGTSFDPMLLHPDRVFHISWRGGVDGYLTQQTWGGYEGDSILRPIIHLLRSVHKGNWALSQKLYRHSTPLRAMKYEEGVSDEQIDKADKAISNVNAKSSILEPPGFELRTVDDGRSSSPQIEQTYNVLFNQICAGTEFTKSVLFGTQVGTTTGSESDIKNYFNSIERDRENRYEDELRSMFQWYSSLNADDYDPDPDATLEWGPLFKLSRLDQAEAMARHVQMASQAANNYIITPDEARSILQYEWADWTMADISGDAPVSAEDVMGEDMDTDMDGNPAVGQNGGGVEQGENQSQDNPTTE